MKINLQRAQQILASYHAQLALIQFRAERLMIGFVLLVMIAVLAALLRHGFEISTWSSDGTANPHLIPYSIGGWVLFRMILRRWKYFW